MRGVKPKPNFRLCNGDLDSLRSARMKVNTELDLWQYWFTMLNWISSSICSLGFSKDISVLTT